ncbi:hypothetical protein ABL78_7847 [Leptomonas seymouri]|uniref:Ubiquitin-like domain-containing protein n=1 Tax=Leptomonas seymouri TaxID=5684 RepID=A0A0N0P2M5_LEPSE|nr:hypothetical protein ABL78_7847 [Leptomonas seymouri]|eukprot:KPI83126.1 hypothetical protein ABL78_7847 [Leptomonas seymouri]
MDSGAERCNKMYDDADAGGEPTRCLYVLSDVDGYKYKLVLQGAVQQLPVKRIKKYLQMATGLLPPQQLLSFNGVALQDDFIGEEAGLFDGAILRLQQVAPSANQHRSGGSACELEDSSDSVRGSAGRPLQRTTRRFTSSSYEPVGLTVVPQQKLSPVAGNVQLLTTTTTAASSVPPTSTHSPPIQSQCEESEPDGRQDVRVSRSRFRALPYTQPFSGAPPSPLPAAAVPPTYASELQSSVEHSRRHHDQVPLTVNLESVKEVGHSYYDDAQGYRRDMEAKVAALSLENVRLREQLQAVARQAAVSNTDWRQGEEIERLKTALTAAKQSLAEAAETAAQRWRTKEEELVKELDLLREERRRLQEDSAAQETRLHELLHSMEGEIRSLKYELRDRDEALQSTRQALAGLQSQLNQREGESPQRNGRLQRSLQEEASRTHSIAALRPLSGSIDVLAEEALSGLAYFLLTPAPLQLDPTNDTCVVSVSEKLNLLVTLDRETEHLYLYVVLLSELPTSPVQRMRVYELLLQGALLGKDMAGGGVGLSTESNLILMSTSADLRHRGALALAANAPSFVESAKAWEEHLEAFLSN